MYGAHQGTNQTRALARAKRRLFSIQWGNKREKMQRSKTDGMHVKTHQRK